MMIYLVTALVVIAVYNYQAHFYAQWMNRGYSLTSLDEHVVYFIVIFIIT